MKTLGETLILCEAVFGKDSKATTFLREKVTKQGSNEPMVASEEQTIQILLQLHNQLKGQAP